MHDTKYLQWRTERNLMNFRGQIIHSIPIDLIDYL